MKEVTLNNGQKMPTSAFGVYLITDAEVCEKSVLDAFKSGYRHIDTANAYMNEKAVGRAMQKSGLKREEIYLTTKIWPTMYKTELAKKAIDETLMRLDTPYIDLLLLHQGYGEYLQAWKVMEEYVKKGKIKSIGVSNFSKAKLEKLFEIAEILPVVNQIEAHPYHQQKEMQEYLNKKGILIQSWYPMGHGDQALLTEKLFTELANKYNKTNAQIILRWHVQSGKIVIAKSTNPEHIRENYNMYDFTLTAEEMEAISKMDKKLPYYVVPEEDTRGFATMEMDFNAQV